MAFVQLYAKKQGTEEYVALDLNESEPIKLNLSVANIIDPTATNSVFSRTFRVPHTSVNGPYFKGVFNVNSINFDAAAKADAYILDNGIFFENGNIRLNAIYTNSEDNSVEYEITFYGATSDFGSKIGGGFLNEVNLNAFNHSKNYQNITASWTGGLFNGDVVYGLIEWGYTYDNNNRPNIPTLSAGFERSFTNPVTSGGLIKSPYKLQQWKPQIRAKALWDKIFEEAGYTYDSTFLNSDFFKKQYIISDNEARALLDNANTFRAENQGVTYNVLAAQFPWITPIEIEDPGSNFVPNQTTSGIYTAPATGNYRFRMKADQVEVYLYGAGSEDGVIGWEAKVIDVDTNQVVGLDVGQWTFSQYGNSETLNAEMYTYVNANQRLKFEFRTFRISGPVYSGSTQIQFFGTSVECFDAPNIMSFNAIMPANIRKIDFMKSIINRYRLVFVPSKFEANHFTITPWKDWIFEGRSKDWTNKLDASKDMVIKPLFFDQARFQIYKDQEDSDYLNYNYQLGIKQTFGQLNLDSTNELIKGTKEYKDQFAPTPLDGIGFKTTAGGAGSENSAAAFLIPHMAKDTGGNAANDGTVSVGKREPIQPKLRLVFYNGLKTAPITWYMADDLAGNAAPPLNQYPMMSQYSEWPVTSTTFDLNWENEEPLYDVERVTAFGVSNPKAQTGFSCFNTFWKTWYDVTFDPYSRIVEANFVLDYNDILDLKFNDYVFVKDAWYFVNSITDYVTGSVSNCKVQLVKLGNNVGITLPVVSPPTYALQETCYHPTVKCTAACCATYNGSTTATIYTDSISLSTSTIAYQDQFGGILAAPGYYKNSTGTIYVNGNGAISLQDTSDCNCVPVYYTFTAFLNTSGCNVCCSDGQTVTLYGANPVFEQNGSFYQNTLLTLPAPAGFYKQSGATFALQVTPNGSVVNNFLCSNCNCTVYYPFTVCKANTLCDSCCCPRGTMQVWGTNATFANNTKLYLDNAGATPAPAAWYKFDSTTVAQVTGLVGDITAFGTCSGCPTCPAGPVEITVNISAERLGYTTSTILQKSYDNGTTWTDIGTLTIEAGDPANTQKSQIFNCEENVRVRAISSTNTVGGTMQTNYYIDVDLFSNQTQSTPATRTLTIASAVTQDFTYEFNNIVTGGASQVDTVYTSGCYDEYQNTGWPSSGGTSIGSILGLNNVADVYTPFNVPTGFYGGVPSNITFVDQLEATSDALFTIAQNVTGAGIDPVSYKGVALTKVVTKLDYSGNLNTTFQSNFPISYSTSQTGINSIIRVINNKLYFYGGGQLIATDLNGNLDTSFNADFSGLFSLPFISDIVQYNNLIYLIGTFRYRPGAPGTQVYHRPFRVLNLDGSLNTTVTNTLDSFLDSTTFAGGTANKVAIYNNKFYVTGSFTTWGASTVDRFMVIDPTTGVLDSTFHATSGGFTGGGNSTVAVVVNASGAYVSTNCTTYKGAAIHPLVKLNHDGTLNPTFVTGSILNRNNAGTTPRILKINNTGDIYAGGDFKTINNVETRNLAKINGTTGALVTAFDVNIGFNALNDTVPSISSYVAGIYLSAGAPITTYPISIAYSSDAPCIAQCTTPKSTIIYGNGVSLSQSTILYADATGGSFAAVGWYSDGGTIAQVDGNGIITAYIDILTCNCSNLYQFEVTYDIDTCVSCGTTGTPGLETVFGANSNWSSNNILYYDQAGTLPVAQGWYTYAGGVALYVGTNGYVQNGIICDDFCGISSNCAGYRVFNFSGNFINYSYYTCGTQNIEFGTLYPGEVLFTPCIVEGSLSAPGAQITTIGIC